MNQPWGPWPPNPAAPAPTPSGEINAMASFIWRPDGVASDTVLTTWADVEAAIVAANGFCTIYVDNGTAECHIDAAADVACKNRTRWLPYTPDAVQCLVYCDDGCIVRNPAEIQVTFLCAPTVQPPIVLDATQIRGQCIFAGANGSVILMAGSLVSAIDCIEAHIIQLLDGGRLTNAAGVPALSTIRVGDGFTLLLYVTGLVGQVGLDPLTVMGGAAGGDLQQFLDASCPPVTQTNFLGTVEVQQIDMASGVFYDDSTVPTPSIGGTVQAALDTLKSLVAPTSQDIVLSWGGTLNGAPPISPVVNGGQFQGPVAMGATSPLREISAPYVATLNRISWNTENADATTEMTLSVNGVDVVTITLTGPSGFKDFTPVVIGPSDLIGLYFSAGTLPFQSDFRVAYAAPIPP